MSGPIDRDPDWSFDYPNRALNSDGDTTVAINLKPPLFDGTPSTRCLWLIPAVGALVDAYITHTCTHLPLWVHKTEWAFVAAAVVFAMFHLLERRGLRVTQTRLNVWRRLARSGDLCIAANKEPCVYEKDGRCDAFGRKCHFGWLPSPKLMAAFRCGHQAHVACLSSRLEKAYLHCQACEAVVWRTRPLPEVCFAKAERFTAPDRLEVPLLPVGDVSSNLLVIY